MGARFEGRRALVTGGASGIGRATAERLATEGARVMVADVDAAAGRAVADAVGGDFRLVDVREPGAVQESVEAAVGTFGGLDVVVSAAGVLGPDQPLHAYDAAAWDRVLDINLRGTYLVNRAALAVLRERGGALVNVASAAAFGSFRHQAAYAASKAAIVGLTRTAAVEYAREGVRVNCVAPGAIATPMADDYLDGDEAKREAIARAHPLGRLGGPEEVASAITWLASDDASFVTGHTLVVDGGLLAE